MGRAGAHGQRHLAEGCRIRSTALITRVLSHGFYFYHETSVSRGTRMFLESKRAASVHSRMGRGRGRAEVTVLGHPPFRLLPTCFPPSSFGSRGPLHTKATPRGVPGPLRSAMPSHGLFCLNEKAFRRPWSLDTHINPGANREFNFPWTWGVLEEREHERKDVKGGESVGHDQRWAGPRGCRGGHCFCDRSATRQPCQLQKGAPPSSPTLRACQQDTTPPAALPVRKPLDPGPRGHTVPSSPSGASSKATSLPLPTCEWRTPTPWWRRDTG